MDELLAYTVGSARYFVHNNHLFSPAAVTDGTGAVVERYAYDAYGKRTVTNAAGTVELATSSVSQSRGYTGYILDQETGWYHARIRPYSPTLGRFPSRDPLGYVDGASLYRAYFAPNGLDPFGLFSTPPWQGRGRPSPDPVSWPSSESGEGECCNSSGEMQKYNKATHCCEDGVVVEKVSVFVINRSAQRSGLTGGHIDMFVPGIGLTGYYGDGSGLSGSGASGGRTGGSAGSSGGSSGSSAGSTAFGAQSAGAFRMTGFFLSPTYEAWNAWRPDYIGRGMVSQICEVKVCPSDAESIGGRIREIASAGSNFIIAGGNCSSRAACALGAGGVGPGGIPGPDNPQALIDMLRRNYSANCFYGQTVMDPSGHVTIVSGDSLPPIPAPHQPHWQR